MLVNKQAMLTAFNKDSKQKADAATTVGTVLAAVPAAGATAAVGAAPAVTANAVATPPIPYEELIKYLGPVSYTHLLGPVRGPERVPAEDQACPKCLEGNRATENDKINSGFERSEINAFGEVPRPMHGSQLQERHFEAQCGLRCPRRPRVADTRWNVRVC